MSPGRYERELLAPLLLVGALVAGCGGEDTPSTAPSGERGSSAPAKQEPAARPEPEAEQQSSGRQRAPARGPRRAAIMRRLDGRRIRVDGKRVRIDSDTLACGRAGTTDAGGRPRARFRCVQPTFPAGSVVGPDAIFLVHAAAGRLVISNARLTSY